MKKDINKRIDIVVKAMFYGVATATAIILHNLFIHIYYNHLPL